MAQMRQRGIIINVQHTPLPWYNGLRQRCYRRRDLSNMRQVDVEGCPLSRGAVHGDRSTVVGDNAVDNRQPHPCAFSDPFGGEEWFKDMLDHVGRHPVASIPYAEPGVGAGPKYRRLRRGRLLHLHSIKAYCQRTSHLPHGMCGIGAQVQHNLVHFRDAREDCPHILLHVLLE